MAKFKYRTIKHMQPKDGAKYSTDYYKQSPREYTRLDEHVRAVMERVVQVADANELIDELYKPLPGFPRTQRQANYSTWDIMSDMLDQINKEKDIPSGMLGRWNRLFRDNEEFQIDMQEEYQPNPIFNKVFYQ